MHFSSQTCLAVLGHQGAASPALLVICLDCDPAPEGGKNQGQSFPAD